MNDPNDPRQQPYRAPAPPPPPPMRKPTPWWVIVLIVFACLAGVVVVGTVALLGFVAFACSRH